SEISQLTFTTADSSAADYWNKPQIVRVAAKLDPLDPNAREGTQYAHITHQVVADDLDEYFNLTLNDVAEGLKAKVLGDLTGQYTATASGDSTIVKGKVPIVYSVPEDSAALQISGTEAAYLHATITPSGAVTAG